MKVIESDSGFLAYQKIFKHMQQSGRILVVWQVHPDGVRSVTETRLNAYYMETKQLHFDLPSGHQLDHKLPLYLYSEDGQFIFKTTINELSKKVITLAHPQKIIMLDDLDATTISGKTGIDLSPIWKVKRLKLDEQPDNGEFDYLFKSMSERTSRDQDFLSAQFAKVPLDEEDKLFAELRGSPRARPKNDKTVKVSTFNNKDVFEFKLYDLSTGGISFITVAKSVFIKGSKIKIVGFDEFMLDDPLIAEVMSERPVDETMVEFKIGCKFDEGQS